MSRTELQRTGRIGEDIAVRFLLQKGFRVIERNYLRKCGEIDIVCDLDGVTHFIEVKTVSRATSSNDFDIFRPEDHVHRAKLERIGRTIQMYLNETLYEGDWIFDVLAIEMDKKSKVAKVRFVEDLVL